MNATASTKAARPLHELVPLIETEIKLAQEAARPFYAKAGELLAEAKSQVEHGKWEWWVETVIHIAPRTAREWMQYAKASVDSQNGADSAAFRKPPGLRETTRPNYKPPDKQPVDVEEDGENDEEGMENEEKELAIRLVDVGYKVLALELHPDKDGGSHEAMVRLNKVHELLKEAIQESPWARRAA